MARWFLYLLECRDGSLYAGIATDVQRRYEEHMAGSGARYTRSHPPLRVLGCIEYPGRAEASRAEHAIKKLTPARKRALCESWGSDIHDAPAPPDTLHATGAHAE